MIGRTEIATINRTRLALRRLAEKAEREGASVAFADGKIDEACEAAERALANVLIVASAYFGSDITDADLYLEGET